MLAGTQKPMLGTKLNRAHPLAKGLRGCWLFNEGIGNVAYDSSGYGNHGTLINMAHPATTASGWNPGRRGLSIAFDGSNDYIDCGNDTSLNITDAITIEAWMKPESTTGFQVIVNKWKSNITDKSYLLWMNNDEIELYLRYNDDSDESNLITTTSPLSIGNWFQVVATSDNLNIKIYVNGKFLVSSPHTQGIAEADAKVYVGIYADDNHPFNGVIDEVKMCNRALGAEEIKWLYREPYAMFKRGELLL